MIILMHEMSLSETIAFCHTWDAISTFCILMNPSFPFYGVSSAYDLAICHLLCMKILKVGSPPPCYKLHMPCI